ncbi:hypothetical protein Acsp06_64830 [Actinomycetospora sp. NBRC 106375]|nr:hypothetical protein Acsp06_64830 [Actinomycetospora sp. NBRC 106375]
MGSGVVLSGVRGAGADAGAVVVAPDAAPARSVGRTAMTSGSAMLGTSPGRGPVMSTKGA